MQKQQNVALLYKILQGDENKSVVENICKWLPVRHPKELL